MALPPNKATGSKLEATEFNDLVAEVAAKATTTATTAALAGKLDTTGDGSGVSVQATGSTTARTLADWTQDIGVTAGETADNAAAALAAQLAAEQAQASAEAAQDAAAVAGKVYVSTAAGLAASAEGEFFSVPSAGSSESLILYREETGVAVQKKTYPTADSAIRPTWTGKYAAWPDPFFRRFDLTSQTLLGRDRWYWNGLGTGQFDGWVRVASSIFDGYALRREADHSSTPLNGPVIWLDEIGAVAGDTITVYLLITGSGGNALASGRFDSGTDNAWIGVQVNPLNATGGTYLTATSATPQWLRHVHVVPAGATRLAFFPYTSTAGATFEIVALWAFKGNETAGPEWPSQQEEGYQRIRDADLAAVEARLTAPDLSLPPELLLVVGREFNVYFENLTPASSREEFSWEVSTPSLVTVVRHQNERFTYTPEGAHVATAITIEARDKRTGEVLATAAGTVKAAAAAAGTGTTPKCIFVGDSLTSAGTYTGELVTIAGGDAMGISLLGTQGAGSNKHEGRAGWTINSFVTAGSPFYISGAVNFPQYLTDNAIAVPDWVFVMLGINDCFSQTTDAGVVALAATELAKLDTLITSIKAAGAGVKVGVMIPTPPSADQDSFGANYYAAQSRDRFKRNIVLWAKEVITKYQGQTASRIYLVPTNVNLDTVNNMSRAAAAPVNSRSSVQVARQSNGVHPATEGYYQIADTVWAFLKNQ